jgi:hypothetical protein
VFDVLEVLRKQREQRKLLFGRKTTDLLQLCWGRIVRAFLSAMTKEKKIKMPVIRVHS